MRRHTVLALALTACVLLPACIVVDGGGGGGGTTSSDAGSRTGRVTFTVVNNASQAIHYIYMSPGDDMSWGADLLTVDVLAPGDQCEITLEPGVWDVKCVAESGQELIFWDQDISAGMSLTIFDQ